MNRNYLTSLFRHTTANNQSATIPYKRHSRGFRPALEQLEERNTPSSVSLVKSFVAGLDGSVPTNFTEVNGTLFFSVDDGVHGSELWKSNGTAAGTVMIKEIRPGVEDPYINSLTNVNGTLFFVADDGAHGWELWKSDGTAPGTVIVKDIYAGSESGLLNEWFNFLTNVNGTLFFAADDGIHGTQLWKSDGTTAGTVMITNLAPEYGGAIPTDLMNVNGSLFFTAYDETYGQQLWTIDGTTAFMVTNIDPDLSLRAGLTNVNGTLFFTVASSIDDSWELWKSDGTSAGTAMVKHVDPGMPYTEPGELTNVNGTLFFIANDGIHGYELWKSDGTAGGTVMVKDIYAGDENVFPMHLTEVNNTLFFVADNGTHGYELWKSDGTAGGTVMVKDIYHGSISVPPRYLINVNGTLLFGANDGTHGYELWTSNGTAAGTVMLRDIWAGAGSSNPGVIEGGVEFGLAPNWTVTADGTLYFSANNGTQGSGLWKLGAIPAPTVTAPSSQTYFANVKNTISGISIAGEGLLQVTLSAASGTITLASTTGLTFTAGANNTANMTFSGTLAKLNAALTNLKYRAGNESLAPDTLTITANNGMASDTQTVSLTAATNTARLQVNSLATTQNDLAIYGTAGDDIIRVNPSGTMLAVTINGVAKGKFAPTGRILIFGQAGNDDIAVGSTIARSSWVYGGTGNDTVVGGAAADLLLGGDGDDYLNGKGGRDLLIGGYGADLLNGDVGDDLLIGGATTFDGIATSLKSIRAEWVRTDAVYAKRVDRLRGLQSGGYNGALQLNPSTVLNDAQADTFVGGAALDCFFQALGSDTITDSNNGGTETIVLL